MLKIEVEKNEFTLGQREEKIWLFLFYIGRRYLYINICMCVQGHALFLRSVVEKMSKRSSPCRSTDEVQKVKSMLLPKGFTGRGDSMHSLPCN